MAWELTGNAGTAPATNFLGTTDSQPLVIKTGGSEAMRIYTEQVGIGIGGEQIGQGSPLILGFQTGLGLGGASYIQSSGELRINPFIDSGTSVSIGFKELGHSKLSAALTVVPLSSQVGIVIGQPDITQGGNTSLTLSINDNDGYGIIQAIKSSGSAFGDLGLNPDGGNVGIGTRTPDKKLTVNGDISVTGDVILTGGRADCAEEFDIAGVEEIEPGTVMVIDQGGVLQQSQYAYDKRVAGIVSGAGGYRPGLILDKQQSQDNRIPIALVGKVYCRVDAQYAPIEVGDLLTTSSTPGHAMKADDPSKAFGSVIGKALRPLEAGQGIIPILIALQ